MTLKLNTILTSQSSFVTLRKCKLKYKVLIKFTLRSTAKNASFQTFNLLPRTVFLSSTCYATVPPGASSFIPSVAYCPKGVTAEEYTGLRMKGHATDGGIKKGTGNKGSSNKNVNKKFIKFFKHWYFDMAPISQDNNQLRKHNHPSLMVLPPEQLKIAENKQLEPRVTPPLSMLIALLGPTTIVSAKDTSAVHDCNSSILNSALAVQKVEQQTKFIRSNFARGKNSVSKWSGFSSLAKPVFIPEAFHNEEDSVSSWMPQANGITGGLSFKLRKARLRPANTKLYLQNILRSEWFLLKKVTALKEYLTTFINQGTDPTIRLTNKQLHVSSLEAKTTNLNSILAFWLLSFVAVIMRLKLEKPDLNLFLGHYHFGVSSAASIIVPQTSPALPFLLPGLVTLPVEGGRQLHAISPLEGYDSIRAKIAEHKGLVGNARMHELLNGKVKLLNQNNQIEPIINPVVSIVGTFTNYIKVSKLPLSPFAAPTIPKANYPLRGNEDGIKKGRLDQHYFYNFCSISSMPHYSTILRMANHQYNKKLSQREYLLSKNNQEESLFLKSPGVIGWLKPIYKRLPELAAVKNSAAAHPPLWKGGVGLKPVNALLPFFIPPGGTVAGVEKVRWPSQKRNITQTTKIYRKASYLLSNLVKAQAFNNGFCFSYLPSISKSTPHLDKELGTKNFFKKRIDKNKIFVKQSPTLGTAVAVHPGGVNMSNLIANGLASLSVPNVFVDKKEGLHLTKYIKVNVLTFATESKLSPGGLQQRSREYLGVNSRLGIFTLDHLFGARPLSGGWGCFKLNSLALTSNILPITSSVEGSLFISNPKKLGEVVRKKVPLIKISQEAPLTYSPPPKYARLSTVAGINPAEVVKDALHVFLFRTASFFQNLLWDRNIYSDLWLKSLITKNGGLTFKDYVYDKGYLWSSLNVRQPGAEGVKKSPPPVNPNPLILSSPHYLSPIFLPYAKHRGMELKRDKSAGLAPTDGLVRKTENKRRPAYQKPIRSIKANQTTSPPVHARHTTLALYQEPGRGYGYSKSRNGRLAFVVGEKAGNTRLLRSFMLLLNHKKFQAKKKLAPFSAELELSFEKALSSKAGKKIFTVYETRKVEKQEYRAQKENIELMVARPKKRKRVYPRPDWLRVRLYESLLTPPFTIKSSKVIIPIPLGVVRKNAPFSPNASIFAANQGKDKQRLATDPDLTMQQTGSKSAGVEKTQVKNFREKRSVPFQYGWGDHKSSFFVPTFNSADFSLAGATHTVGNAESATVGTAGFVSQKSRFKNWTILDKQNLIAHFQALFNFNTLGAASSRTLAGPKINKNQPVLLLPPDSSNIFNNNFFRVWFFNTFYNFDSSNFLTEEIDNLSMLRIFWSLNQTNMCSTTSFRDTKPNPESWLNTFSDLALSTKKKIGEEQADSVFKGFAPFGSRLKKLSPTQIRDRFASVTEHSLHNGRQRSNINYFTGDLLQAPKGRTVVVGSAQTTTALKQSEKQQAQERKKRKAAEADQGPHIEENQGFKNRNDVWWDQKARELAENNKTKFLLRELSSKTRDLTHVFQYRDFLNNSIKSNKISSLTLPLPSRNELVFNLTKYRQKEQKLNYLGFLPDRFSLSLPCPDEVRVANNPGKALLSLPEVSVYPYGTKSSRDKRSRTRDSSQQPKAAKLTVVQKTQTHTNFANTIVEKNKFSPFYLLRTASSSASASARLPKEGALETKKQLLEKTATPKFWWLKNTNFKALYASRGVPNSRVDVSSQKSKGLVSISRVMNKSEVSTILHVMHGKITGFWPNSYRGHDTIILPTIGKVPGYRGSENLYSGATLHPPIFVSLFSLATTVFFHFCCLIGLLSISQVRCAIKFNFILLYKLSKSYTQLISSLYGSTFQYPLSFFGLSYKQHGSKYSYPKGYNAFFKYSKGLVLGKTLGSPQISAMLSVSYSPLRGCWLLPPVGLRLPLFYAKHEVDPYGDKSSRSKDNMSNLLRSRLQVGSTNAAKPDTGNIKNRPWLMVPLVVNPAGGIKKQSRKVLVWLNKRGRFLVARIYPSWGWFGEPLLIGGDKQSWREKKLPAITVFNAGKPQLTLVKQFFILLWTTTSKQVLSTLALCQELSKERPKQLFELQLKIELVNTKNLVSYVRYNSIKTTVTIFQTSRFLFIKCLALLVFYFQQCFEAVLRFFEKPTEVSLDFFAYTFLVELYSDSLSIIPEIMDLTIWSWFQKTTGSLKTSLFFGNLLQRRFFCFFYILLTTLNQPDTALIRQQVKSTLFWDLWADLLMKTVASENQVDISALSRLEEERTSLVDNLLFETEAWQLPSLLDGFLTGWGPQHVDLQTTQGKERLQTKLLHLTKIQHNFKNFPIANPLEISTDVSTPNPNEVWLPGFAKVRLPDAQGNYANLEIAYCPTPYRINKECKVQKKWGANQHVSYQQVGTDLFVDLNVSKSFSHVGGIKYYAAVQYPIGSLVCQIYTGLFETQPAKNILVLGPASASTKTFDAKSLLIQALAGETEIRIIMDNAARYTLINRGLAVGIRLLKEVFNAIALQTPCFFLLEDVHLIGDKRLLLISDSSDAKKILNNQMPLSNIDALEVHEKNQIMIQYSKQAVTHYKKPYRDSAEQSIATNQYCFDFFSQQQKGHKKNNISKRLKGTSLASAIPITNISLNQPKSTNKKLKPKKALSEISFEENSKEPEFILVPRTNYSVRLKVALLAQHTLSNFSAKVDMITDLLVIIDNVRSNKGFVVFATTDRAYRLDPALRRPGRLDETIRVPFLPTASARWEILKSNMGAFFKSTFSPLHVKRSVCLDLTEFTNFSLQVSSSIILLSLPQTPIIPIGIYPHRGEGVVPRGRQSPTVGSNQQPLLSLEIKQVSPSVIKGLGAAVPKSDATFMHALKQQGRKGFAANQRLANYLMLPTVSMQGKEDADFSTLKKSKLDLVGKIGSVPPLETVKIMAYCKVAKKVILNSTVASYKVNSGITCSAAEGIDLPSVYAKGTALYWNSITSRLPQHQQRSSTARQKAKDARNHFIDLEKSEGELNLFKDCIEGSLAITTIKRKLLDLFASKVAESFVCQLFYVNKSQSLATYGKPARDLGKKSVGFFTALTLDDIPSTDWKNASSLVKSFLQKRYMYNKNRIVTSLLCVANGSFVGEFKDDPTSPPHSVILAPSKRYENYKKIFAMQEKKVFIKFSEKIKLHEQQKFQRNLYKFQNSKGAPNKGKTSSHLPNREPTFAGLDSLPLLEASTGNQNPFKGNANQVNLGQTFRPGLAITDPNANESNISNSIEGNYSKLSGVSWYYNSSIVKRHQFYLTNQWFNGQLAEHNAETVFLSDVDWRLTFIEELGDLSIDFPDADQLYNPRRRRWLLNTSSLSGGTASNWHSFYNYDQEISDHLVMQAFNTIYVLLDKNREQLDALSYKLIKTGFLKELHLVKMML